MSTSFQDNPREAFYLIRTSTMIQSLTNDCESAILYAKSTTVYFDLCLIFRRLRFRRLIRFFFHYFTQTHNTTSVCNSMSTSINSKTTPLLRYTVYSKEKKKKGREPKIPNENLTETEEKEDKGCAQQQTDTKGFIFVRNPSNVRSEDQKPNKPQTRYVHFNRHTVQSRHRNELQNPNETLTKKMQKRHFDNITANRDSCPYKGL